MSKVGIRMLRVFLNGMLAICLLGPLAAAQEFRGTISGSVRDPQEAAVPNATVEIVRAGTNEKTTVTTNESGAYVAPFLMPGTYSVTVQAAGFKRSVRSGIELHVGDKLQVDAILEVGAIAESVTVTSQAEQLETATASRGQVIDAAKVRDLPLLGRNPFMLTALATGVDTGLYRSKPSQFGRPFDGASAQMSVNGVGARYELLLDGIPNAPQERSSAAIYVGFVPSPESVEEFKVQTNNYDAQYGRTSGAVVNVVLRSGTNDLHGSFYEYFRNDVLNANAFESNAAGKPRSVMRWNQPGFLVSGPVYIPKVYDGRNKTFFMTSWETIRNSNPNPVIGTMPDDLMRAGNFSQLVQTNGQPITIYDPLTTQLTGGRYLRQPFAGNLIPANRIDPVSKNLLSYWPKPNTTPAAGGFNNYLASPNSQTDTYNQWVVRLDQQINDKNRIFGRWIKSIRNQVVADAGYPAVAGPGFLHYRNNQGGSVDWTSTLTPTLVLNARYGVLNHPFAIQRPGDTFDPTQLGFPSSLVSQLGRATFPGISPAEYTGLNNAESQYDNTLTHSMATTLSKSLGSHTIKTGFEWRALRSNQQLPISNFGTFSFNRGFTQLDSQRGDAASGNSIASYLLGYVSGASVPYNIAPAWQQLYYGLFLHDDWRIGSRLTLNLGLRWDYEGPVSERYDRQNRGFDQTAASALQVPGMQLKGGLLFTDASTRLPFVRDNNNWQPRVGASYRVLRNTVLRGGYGISYLPTWDNGRTNGYSVSTSYVASIQEGIPANRLSNPYPDGILKPAGRDLGLATLLGQTVAFANPDRTIPISHMFSFGIQHQLPWQLMIDAMYVGNRYRDMPAAKNINYVPADKFALGNAHLTASVPNPMAGKLPASSLNAATVQQQQLYKQFPQFLNITENLRPVGKTNYNSLQVSVEKRLSAGAHFRLSYTFSKVMNATGYLNDQDPIDSPVWNQGGEPNHILSLAGGYTLPFFAGRKGALAYALSGWNLGAIFRATAGTLIGAPGNAFSTGVNPKLASDKRSYNHWFNTCTLNTSGVRQNCASADEAVAFVQMPPWTLRTLSGSLPGLRTEVVPMVDISLSKDFPIKERLRFQFKAEAFNLANTPMFGGPNTTLGAGQFGIVTLSQTNDPRVLQLVGKIVF